MGSARQKHFVKLLVFCYQQLTDITSSIKPTNILGELFSDALDFLIIFLLRYSHKPFDTVPCKLDKLHPPGFSAMIYLKTNIQS